MQEGQKEVEPSSASRGMQFGNHNLSMFQSQCPVKVPKGGTQTSMLMGMGAAQWLDYPCQDLIRKEINNNTRGSATSARYYNHEEVGCTTPSI